MKLTDLDPRWVGAGGDGVSDAQGRAVPERHGVGISFNCPCGCDSRVFVHLRNPLDGGPSYANENQPTWEREGETFETLTLWPSIQRIYPRRCWHGFVTKGEVTTC